MIHTFERRQIDTNRLYGSIVAESESLILIHREEEFQLNGYRIIRRRDVSKSYVSASNDYCEGLMRKEGLWEDPHESLRSLPLDDWRSVLTAMSGKPVIVENERTEDFYIGPIVDCEDHSVLIRHFDGCGQWERVLRVQYRCITSVTFGDRYSTIHYRHLPPLDSAQ